MLQQIIDQGISPDAAREIMEMCGVHETERRVPMEIYSRVSGYFRPVNQWNKGKQEEFRLRRPVRVHGINEKPLA